jgi:hypothetical protein
VHDSFRNDKALPRRELDCSVLEINQELTLDNIEKLIVGVMLVPVVFALHNAKTHHGLIDLAQRLVVPLGRASVRERLFVDQFQWFVKNVQMSLVGVGLRFAHKVPPANHRMKNYRMRAAEGFSKSNVSRDYVMVLDANCFGLVNYQVFPEPVVGPVEAPSEYPSPDGSVEGCGRTDSLSKVIRVMPGKSYEFTKELRFEVLDDVPSDYHGSVNPGVWYLQVMIVAAQSWDMGKQGTSLWGVGPKESGLLRFEVNGKAKPRRAKLRERGRAGEVLTRARPMAVRSHSSQIVAA